MNEKAVEKQKEPSEQDLLEVLEDVPEKSKKIIEQMMVSTFQMRSETPETIVAQNITAEHISKFIDETEKEVEYAYNDKKHTRRFVFAITVVALAFMLLIINMLKGTPEIMEKVLYTMFGFVAGVVGGYGFGKSKNSDE